MHPCSLEEIRVYALGEEGSCVGSDKVQTSTRVGKMRWYKNHYTEREHVNTYCHK